MQDDIPEQIPGALRRMNAAIGEALYSPPQPSWQQALQHEVKELKDMVKLHNEFIVQELAEIKISLRQMQRQRRINEEVAKLFPLTSKDSLQKFETEINNLDENELVIVIQTIIGGGGLARNLNKLLDREIILNFNYNGVQQKEAFKAFQLTNEVFYKAVEKDLITRDNYIKELKKGFKLHKNKLHKLKCLENKQKRN